MLHGGTKQLHAQVAVRAERNNLLDQQSLIVRYQQQMASLRAHLRRVSSAATGVHDPMHPEVWDLFQFATLVHRLFIQSCVGTHQDAGQK